MLQKLLCCKRKGQVASRLCGVANATPGLLVCTMCSVPQELPYWKGMGQAASCFCGVVSATGGTMLEGNGAGFFLFVWCSQSRRRHYVGRE